MRPKLTYANVVATLALCIAVGGASAFAASQLGKNSVGTKQLKKNSVTTAKIKKQAVTAAKVKNGTLTGAQVNASTLGTVPNASQADNASKFGGVVPIPPATPISLLNGWQPYGNGYDQPAYWQDADGVVHLKGSVAQPVPGSDVIFVLPSGLRPARSTNWPTTLDSAHFGTIEIEADGSVRSRTFEASQATESRLFTSMEGVSFRPSDP